MTPRRESLKPTAASIVLLWAIALLQGCDITGSRLKPLPRISVDRLYADTTHYNAIVRITNDIEPRGYRLVGMSCTFLRKGAAVDESGNVVTNLAYRQTVFETVIGPYAQERVDSVSCRVTYANL